MAVPIEDTVNYDKSHPSVVERYYTPYFCLDAGGKEGEDHCILLHSNRICLVTLAPSHPVVSQQKKVQCVDFQVSDTVNRLENQVSGKGKHGAQSLKETSQLCTIKCEDGTEYSVLSCVKGRLVEINDNLVTNPSLLVDKPQSSGFIAVVLVGLNVLDSQIKMMHTLDQYKATRDRDLKRRITDV